MNGAEKRKDPAAREEIINAADVAFFCLPDAASMEAAQMVHGNTAVIDTSTAHRTNPDWDYGFPELHGLREKIRKSRLPSCGRRSENDDSIYRRQCRNHRTADP